MNTKTSTKSRIKNMVIAGLLIALAIIIPQFMPKFVLPPFSFTVASHMPIYLAAFISPVVAAVVALGSALGFLLSGLPVYIAARAGTHIVFAIIAAYMLKNGWAIKNALNVFIMLLITGVVHGGLEVLVVIPFGFGGDVLPFTVSVLGGGTIIHNAVDFFIAFIIYKALSKANLLRDVTVPLSAPVATAAIPAQEVSDAAKPAIDTSSDSAEEVAEDMKESIEASAEQIEEAAEGLENSIENAETSAETAIGSASETLKDAADSMETPVVAEKTDEIVSHTQE